MRNGVIWSMLMPAAGGCRSQLHPHAGRSVNSAQLQLRVQKQRGGICKTRSEVAIKKPKHTRP
jgi:hypothetical protein